MSVHTLEIVENYNSSFYLESPEIHSSADFVISI